MYSKYLAREPHIASLLQPSFLREKCRKMGEESVAKHNEYSMTNAKVLQLITDLSTIMWVTSYMSNNDQFSHVLRVLEGCVEEAKSNLDPENIDTFNANVMVHIHHIKVGVSRMQPLDADIIVEDATEDVATLEGAGLVEEVDDEGEIAVLVEDGDEEVVVVGGGSAGDSDAEYGVAQLVEMD